MKRAVPLIAIFLFMMALVHGQDSHYVEELEVWRVMFDDPPIMQISIPHAALLASSDGATLTDGETADVLQFLNAKPPFAWFVLPLLLECTESKPEEIEAALISPGAKYLTAIYADRSGASPGAASTTRTLELAVAAAEPARYMLEEQTLMRHALYWGFNDLLVHPLHEIEPFLQKVLCNPFLFRSVGKLQPENIVVAGLMKAYGQDAADYFIRYMAELPVCLNDEATRHSSWKNGGILPLLRQILTHPQIKNNPELLVIRQQWTEFLAERSEMPSKENLLAEYQAIIAANTGNDWDAEKQQFADIQQRLAEAWIVEQLSAALEFFPEQ